MVDEARGLVEERVGGWVVAQEIGGVNSDWVWVEGAGEWCGGWCAQVGHFAGWKSKVFGPWCLLDESEHVPVEVDGEVCCVVAKAFSLWWLREGTYQAVLSAFNPSACPIYRYMNVSPRRYTLYMLLSIVLTAG